MKKLITIKLCIFSLFLAFSVPGLAEPETPEVDNNPDQAEYLTPDQMTEEDYAKLSDSAAEYDACLSDKSAEQLNNYNDPRQVVDTAMKQCVPVLENLKSWMIERKFPPGFANHYIRKTVNRTVTEVLPKVMMQTAARQSAAEQENK